MRNRQRPEEPAVSLADLLAQTPAPALPEPNADLRTGGLVYGQLLASFIGAGFTRAEALQLVLHQMTLNHQTVMQQQQQEPPQ